MINTFMKDWQVKKINDMYTQIDRLTEENKRLKHQAESELHEQIKLLSQDMTEIKQLLTTDKAPTKRVTKKR